MSLHGVNALVLRMADMVNTISCNLMRQMQDDLIDVTGACLNPIHSSSIKEDKILVDARGTNKVYSMQYQKYHLTTSRENHRLRSCTLYKNSYFTI